MKSFLNKLSKQAKAGLLAVLLIAGLSGTALAAFGPDRATKAWVENGPGFDYVTFNSFTGVPGGIGDERDFVRGVQVGRDSVWSDPVANVEQDKEVEVKIFVHNNADPSLNDAEGNPGIAKNVTVKAVLPSGSNKTQEITSFITSSNANPVQVFDTLTMTGANNGYFELSLVPNSAKLMKEGTTTDLTDAEEQALVGGGYNTGDQKGCAQYVREITFRVKVKMPRYTVAKQVTTPGSTDWKENLDAKPGDTVSWLVTFKNTGSTELKSVKMVDEVPAGLTVVPGSVKLVNGNYPNGYVYPDTAIQANGRQVNVDMGNYNPEILGYVTYRTTVATAEPLTCGVNTITNKAFTTPEGYGAIFDTAQTTVTRTCATTPNKPVTPVATVKTLPATGPGEVFGLFTAATTIGAVAHRVRASRR